ncbi:MAG: NADAR family protein [Melioribacteraceae bacterium]
MKKIKEFQGEYRWLSNFAPCKVKLDGIIYESVEHAYMSAKSDNIEWKAFCQDTKFAGTVKKQSRSIKLIDNWNKEKFNVMRKCLEQKFRQEPYKSKLINTANLAIEEGNNWNDKIWGICLKTGQGQNNLGKMIMEIRSSLLNGPTRKVK